jgi:NAD(P)-dependent dehydrogenase (short-subunit alcohol dehydrogenase family)
MKIAVVTGGSSGLGAALIDKLIEHKFHVVTTSRRSALNKSAEWIKTDLSKPEEVNAFADSVMEKYGSIKLLINNAALSPAARLINMSFDEFQEVINVDFVAPRILMNRFASKLTGGSIVNVVSRVGIEGRIGLTAYGAAKELLFDYSLLMAPQFAKQLVKVFTVNPGFMFTENISDKVLETQKQESILNRYMTPELSAKLILQIVKQNFGAGNLIDLDSRIYKIWSH